MSTSISTAFVAEYESGVKLAYQQMAAKLRALVRLKSGVIGSTETFQKLGKGIATQKARHGNVAPMNPNHSVATATLEDWYAGDYIGRLDELKIKHDEKQAIAQTGAAALGTGKADDLIITAMVGTTTDVDINYGGNAAIGFTKAKVMSAFETLNAADVPDDGQRFCAVSAHQWNELLNISEFKSSDYVGSNVPWLSGTEAKRWLNVYWIMHTGLSSTASIHPGTASTAITQRVAQMWHKSAVGLAEGADVHSQIDWVPEKAEHFADSWMSMGAVLIDVEGCINILSDDGATTTLA